MSVPKLADCASALILPADAARDGFTADDQSETGLWMQPELPLIARRAQAGGALLGNRIDRRHPALPVALVPLVVTRGLHTRARGDGLAERRRLAPPER